MRAPFLFTLAALLVLGGCAKPCGPSSCSGCCDSNNVCHEASPSFCGQSGGACQSCVGFQQCLLGVCATPGGSGSGSGNGSGSSSTSSSTSASSAGSTGASASSGTSGSASSGTAGTSGAASSGTGTSSASSSSSSSASTGTTGASSSSSSSSSGGTTASTDASLHGTVYSGSPSNPVAGAAVSVVGPTQVIASTDSQGNFQVAVLAGSYQLTASAGGYQPSSQSASVAQGQTASVSFDLAPQGTTATSASSASSSSSSSGTTGAGTTGTTGATTGSTTGGVGEGSGTVNGPLGFTVGAALEFTAKDQDGGPDTSDVAFILYDAPITCADVTAVGGAVPYNLGVRHIAYGEARNTLGYPLQGGDYGIPSQNFGLDQDSLSVRTFFDDGGYSEVTASSGNIHLNGPIQASELMGSYSVVMSDASNLVGTLDAFYCAP